MGLNLSFFRTPRHRVFNYQPLYYDERKEELDEKIENARKRDKGEYVPGESVKGSFRRIKYDVKRSNDKAKLKRVIILITLVVFMIALVYFSKSLDFFWIK